jgi:hypothetical protein
LLIEAATLHEGVVCPTDKPQGGLTWFQLKAGEDAFLWAEVGLR